MRVAVTALACGLAVTSAALMLADFSHYPPETPAGMRLGSIYVQDDFWSVEQMRSRIDLIGYASAAKVLGPVLERDASSSYRWTDLGEVFSGAGDRSRAVYCYRRAEELAPHDPQILYAIGGFYAADGNTAAALAHFASTLGLMGAPQGDVLTGNIFSYYKGMTIREHGLLAQAIPDGKNARAYLRYLVAEMDTVALPAVWQWIREKKFDDEPLTIKYVNFLFLKKQFDAAEEGWLQGFTSRKDGYSPSSPVFNGGFEYELTGGIPDWHFDGFEGVKAKRDRGSRFEGQFSLRVDFSGNDNPDFHHVQQMVFVQPGRYRFEAQVRTANITSDQGVLFRIVSAKDGRTMAETDALKGTNDWTRLNTTLEFPRGTGVAGLQLTRRRSIRIDNQLTGTVWMDAVKLTRIQ